MYRCKPTRARHFTFRETDAGELEGSWLLLPEVPHVGGDDIPRLPIVLDYARFYGLRTAAVFYDLIPLRQPGYEVMAAEHEAYVRALVAVDLVTAISKHSADDLSSWWAEEGYEPAQLPSVVAVPLAAEVVESPRVLHADKPQSPVRFTAVGTVEPRKNQVALLRSFTRLRTRRSDLKLQLDVVGGIHEAVARTVEEIARGDDSIHFHGYVAEAEVRRLVASSHATIFVSLYEGFGLPIAESLWQGVPCICSDHGSMAEFVSGRRVSDGFGDGRCGDRVGPRAICRRHRTSQAPDARIAERPLER